MEKGRLGWALNIQRRTFISLVVVICSFLVLGEIFLVPYYDRSIKERRETITFATSLFGATVALYGLLRAADNIRKANLEKLGSQAIRFVERWDSPSLYELKKDWRVLNIALDQMTGTDSKEKRISLLEDNLDNRMVAVEFLNFFEEIAIAVFTETVDEDLVKRYFKTIILKAHARYSPWIVRHRELREAGSYWVELDKLVTSWKKGVPI